MQLKKVFCIIISISLTINPWRTYGIVVPILNTFAPQANMYNQNIGVMEAFVACKYAPRSATFSPDDKWLIIGSNDGEMHLYKLEDNKIQYERLLSVESDRAVKNVVFYEDSSRFIISTDYSIVIFSVHANTPIAVLKHNERIQDMHVQNGKVFFLSSANYRDTNIWQWDSRTDCALRIGTTDCLIEKIDLLLEENGFVTARNNIISDETVVEIYDFIGKRTHMFNFPFYIDVIKCCHQNALLVAYKKFPHITDFSYLDLLDLQGNLLKKIRERNISAISVNKNHDRFLCIDDKESSTIFTIDSMQKTKMIDHFNDNFLGCNANLTMMVVQVGLNNGFSGFRILKW